MNFNPSQVRMYYRTQDDRLLHRTTRRPLVSIITVNYNQAGVTAALLQSLSQLHYPHFETIVVDNGSTESAAFLQQLFPSIIYVKAKENKGFAGGNNLGLRHAKGKYVFFVNNDTEVTPDLLDVLVNHMQQYPACGMASPKIKFFHHPHVIQYAGCTGMHKLTSRTYATGSMQQDDGRYDEWCITGVPHGAAMMVPMQLIMQVGTMHEDFFLYYEELDWADRIKRAGYQVHYVGGATIFHKESVTTGRCSALKTYYIYRNRLLYIRRNYRGRNYVWAVAFFVLVSVPLHTMLHLLRRQLRHAKSIVEALIWNIHHPAFSADANEAVAPLS